MGRRNIHSLATPTKQPDREGKQWSQTSIVIYYTFPEKGKPSHTRPSSEALSMTLLLGLVALGQKGTTPESR